MGSSALLRQTLDEKYLIERELGRGGMGTVYLATHVGTERPVAVKVIAPQYMERAEFVERFRREARAAGRLRHPNVVNVTDFGFSDTSEGTVAYLVMEYLDGCTLGEILDEEKLLPLGWTLDILEQVCSAVQEAHEQGIIHRDLKPENIWLEPNQRGGYTVKVLDFGIAKLEEAVASDSSDPGAEFAHLQEPSYTARPTIGGQTDETTLVDRDGATRLMPTGTIAQGLEGQTIAGDGKTLTDSSASEARTAIITPAAAASTPDQEAVGTRLMSSPIEADRSHGGPPAEDRQHTDGRTTGDLTRVGAVLGTPLYMSPEQCMGEKLDARSDVYSLGVIAYQMLSGKTPFAGDFTEVMEAHKHEPAPWIEAKKVRRKVKKVIMSALEKDRDARPQSAEAFASEMRSQSEGIWALLRRALVIFSEHLPKFLGLTTLLSIPVIILVGCVITISFLRVSETIGEDASRILLGSTAALWGLIVGFCAYLIIGTTTLIVTQHLAVPLRPISVRDALKEGAKRWRTFAGTGLLSTVLAVVIGVVTCGIGFLVTTVLWTLLAPVVMMENLRGWKALKRSQTLVRRSLRTTIGAVIIMFLLPGIISGLISFVVHTTANSISRKAENVSVVEDQPTDAEQSPPVVEQEKDGVRFNIGTGRSIRITDENKDMRSRLVATVSESLIQIFWLPMHIFITAFTAIIVALLFLKTRQAGGEPMHELLAKFEETDKPRKRWQERVRNRLIQSGRVTSKP